jgi:hypothetical protein
LLPELLLAVLPCAALAVVPLGCADRTAGCLEVLLALAAVLLKAATSVSFFPSDLPALPLPVCVVACNAALLPVPAAGATTLSFALLRTVAAAVAAFTSLLLDVAAAVPAAAAVLDVVLLLASTAAVPCALAALLLLDPDAAAVAAAVAAAADIATFLAAVPAEL